MKKIRPESPLKGYIIPLKKDSNTFLELKEEQDDLVSDEEDWKFNLHIRTKITNGDILNMKLVDLMCKHIIIHDTVSDAAKKLLDYSVNACNYSYCVWGSHDGHANDILYHIGHIHKMECDSFTLPIRIVRCKYPFSDKVYYWADNLHSTIKVIREFGRDVKLKDVDFYVVDITDLQNVVIRDPTNCIRKNFHDVMNIVECAYKRYRRSNDKHLVELHYTIADFLRDNPSLYTQFNTHLGLVTEEDSIVSMVEKVQAFNSLWDLRR